MNCLTCHKDIPSTSMWYCYRNGQDYCNSCIGSKIELDFKELEKEHKQFKQEIDNLVMSLVIFDDDRNKRGEPMIHADMFARYKIIIDKFKDKTVK